MCNLKSALVLKDRVFMPDYDSHTTMLEELKLKDSSRNPGFVRVEISPPSGNVFENVSGWQYKVDQDFRPDWYVAEYDEQRVRESLSAWAKDRNGKYKTRKALSELAVGETFKIGNLEYVVVEKDAETVSCVTAGVIRKHLQFDCDSNNFAISAINRYLNREYYGWLVGQVGKENIVEHSVDLQSYTADGGYGKYKANISLLTFAQYKKCENILPKTEQYYWLVTPYAKNSCDVCFVDPSGYVYCRGFGWCGRAVRPFCVFKSYFFVDC